MDYYFWEDLLILFLFYIDSSEQVFCILHNQRNLFIMITKKLFKYFNGTTNFAFFNTLLLITTVVDFLKTLDSYSIVGQLCIATLRGFPLLFVGDSSFLNCYKLPDVSE